MAHVRRDMQDLITTLGKHAALTIADTYQTEHMGTLFPPSRRDVIVAERNALIRNLGQASVALVIGGLGIFGVGLAGVRERAQDFGLRRALGASKLRIFTGVIVQTLMEVLLATSIAIPLAALLLEIYARDLVLETLPLPPSTTLPLQSALLGLVSALTVGLIAGLVPAINAARASVVQALRG